MIGYENLRFDVTSGIAEITIARPKALNALNEATLAELADVITRIAKDTGVRCAILTGEGQKAFIAGADIAAMKTMTVVQADAFSSLGHHVVSEIEHLRIPVIAAVNGYALGGGCEIAMCCDLIYASENAKMGQPEVELGLIPGFGGCVRLPRWVGEARARELLYTGRHITAAEAKALGLVVEVFPQDELLGKVREIAATIASKAPRAITQMKRTVSLCRDMDRDNAGRAEQQAFAAMFGTEDAREGLTAFLEKRKPTYRGL